MNLQDIKARVETASVGPWHRDSSSEQDGAFLTENVVSRMWDVATCAGGSTHPDQGRAQQAKADADFIAHARTDIPKLIAALEAVQNVSDDLMRGAFFEESEMSEDILAGQRSAVLNVYAAIRAAFDD